MSRRRSPPSSGCDQAGSRTVLKGHQGCPRGAKLLHSFTVIDESLLREFKKKKATTHLMEAQVVHDGGGGVKDHAVTAHHQGEACQRLHRKRSVSLHTT